MWLTNTLIKNEEALHTEMADYIWTLLGCEDAQTYDRM